MAVRLHVELEKLQDKRPVLHLMPCKIHGDETANVSSYFTPYIRKIDNEHFDCSFRGHPLQGKRIVVPTSYEGVTFYEHKKPKKEGSERNLYCTGKFSEFTYWNYDKIPSKNDALAGALDWIDIAEVVCSNVYRVHTLCT